jgi:predicted CXXCH cytochrome family protein
VKRTNNDTARRIRLRAVVAYPAVSVALIVSVALVLTPFGPSQGSALAALPAPTATAAPTGTVAPTATAAPTTTPPTTAVPSLTPGASSTLAPAATPVTTPAPTPVPSLTLTVTGVPAEHHELARIAGSDFTATYLPVDAPVLNAAQFQAFRVRFRLRNTGFAPMTAVPQLEYRPDGAAGFVVVPEKPLPGIPFHVSREWVPSLGSGGGTKQGPLGEAIAAADLRIGKESGQPVNGHHSMGANPDRSITLPPASYTDEEFTVTTSIDAKYLTGYQLRITSGGAALTGTDVATVRLGAPPAVVLSPGQRQGVAVAAPKRTSAAVAYPLLSGPLTLAATTPAKLAPMVASPSAVLYPLTAGAVSMAPVSTAPVSAAPVSTAAYATPGTVKISDAGIKGSHANMADQCSVCHSAHTAQAPMLVKSASQSTLCFTCHDGTSAQANVEAEYALTRPANDATARDYYSHDAVTSTPSTPSTSRSVVCSDCHNSHRVNSTPSAPTAAGWTASGRLAGVSGVSVANGAADTAPVYTPLDGVASPITLEYQLCFKCHSGSAALPPNAGLKPSQYALDKGIEFNPNNASFHPVEAAGTNATPKMTLSLTGQSPYKLWNFEVGGTVRCLNCHASGATPGPQPADTTPPPADTTTLPLPGSALAPHTSSNRGILLRSYRDRVLKTSTDAYSAKDFGLCYVCHAEEPFSNATGTAASNATNFSLHGKHLTDLMGKGDGSATRGTDIDKAGDGQGNAICAECHFRIHSTTNAVGSQVKGARLVNFAPNVEANGLASPSWSAAGVGGGSCTLTCHGYTHDALSYKP